MFSSIIKYAIQHKMLVVVGVLGMVAWGFFALKNLPIDAVPDITNNQVQVVTVAPTLAPQEVEQFITYPVEMAVANLPKVEEIRSVSRFGLSVVTIVFAENMPLLQARQLVSEQLQIAKANIPAGFGEPELMPITTGLGEIYQYALQAKPGYEGRYSHIELRSIQDWLVKRQLAGTPGIIEVSSFGGFLKQYEVAIDPARLHDKGISLAEVLSALEANNANSGAGYIEQSHYAFYIRTEGMVQSLNDIANIVLATRNNVPVLVRDVADVRFGHAQRFGAMTMDGRGEVVGGITLMLKGANSSEALKEVHQRMERINQSLPEGLEIYPYLDRSVLVGKTIKTVATNLIEGGLIVIFVLVVMLGSWRAGFIVASVIPLAMLFAFIMMDLFGVSANLMSLGAIDFGIVVDGAVIIVEAVLHELHHRHLGKRLSQQEMDAEVHHAASNIYQSAAFGVLIILVVFVPVLTLTGIEGKMFVPMAQTVSFALLGALLLSLTYVPMLTAAFLSKKVQPSWKFSEGLMAFFQKMYEPVLKLAIRNPLRSASVAFSLFIGALAIFLNMGGEFIPTLEEGDLAMQMSIKPGSSLSESVRTTTKAEQILLSKFPEVKHVVSKIGTAEVPTDPMSVEDGDIMIVMKDKEEWTSASNREELIAQMKEALESVLGASFEFSQPIQLRFNELMTGAKADVVVKIFGEDLSELKRLADACAVEIRKVEGAADVKVEQTEGLKQWKVAFDRARMAQYGVSIEEVAQALRASYAGEAAGVVMEGEKRFDLVVRLQPEQRAQLNLARVFVRNANGLLLPISEVARLQEVEGPMQISREKAQRKINIGVNVRQRDVASLVAEIEQRIQTSVKLPAGYYVVYGGQFENLAHAKARLLLAVPAALLLIGLLLYMAFGSMRFGLLIFSAVPLSAIGGIVALWLRDMPFSISAGIGFIALFGVSVLNGLVLIGYFNQLRQAAPQAPLADLVRQGALARLRPVLMTATVASLGFIPMAVSSGNGAEVQRPLATVVIGGIITATLLTLIVLPALYYWVENRRKIVASLVFLLLLGWQAQAQAPLSEQEVLANAQQAMPLQIGQVQVQQAEAMAKRPWQLPALSLGYQGGQINYPGIDYSFSISQSLGDGLKAGLLKQQAQTGVAIAQGQLALTERQLRTELRKHYDRWAFSFQQVQTLLALDSALAKAEASLNSQFMQGSIGKLPLQQAHLQRQELRQQIAAAMADRAQTWQALCVLANLDTAQRRPSQAYAAIPMPALQAEVQPALTQVQNGQVAWAKQQQLLSKKQWLPSPYFGYFQQSLDGEPGFRGWQIGLELPIDRKAIKAAQQKANSEANMATLQLDWENRQLNSRKASLLATLHAYEQALSNVQSNEGAIALASSQLQQGAISYIEFAQTVQWSTQATLANLETMHRFNQSLLELLYIIEP